MICKICGKEFEPNPCNIGQAKYCSAECREVVRKEHFRQLNEKNKAKNAERDRTKRCPICNQDFQAKHNEVYCSDICRTHANRRRKNGHNPNAQPRPKKKLKGLDGLEKQLKKKGDFFDEYRKWKIEQSLNKVTPIILEERK